MQKSGESLLSYIQCWSIIKNSEEDVSEERAIDAFVLRLRRSDFVEEMDRTKLRTVSQLMDVANRFADGEDTYHNKRATPPEDDRPHQYRSQRRSSHNYDRDFYFCALGSLVVLSFPQLLSFSSVLSKTLAETVTSARTAGCPTVEHL
jgi:hypothetical protein